MLNQDNSPAENASLDWIANNSIAVFTILNEAIAWLQDDINGA